MMNLKMKEIHSYAEEMKRLYKELISKKVKETEYVTIVARLVKEQKCDGAWSKLEDYYIDSDCRVEYLYNPTYYASAILMVIDNSIGLEMVDGAKEALEKGLLFATGRNLSGHGYSSMEDQMRNMKCFENAGVYQWFSVNQECADEFKQMWEDIIRRCRCRIAENKVVADWNRDFSKEFKERIDVYEKNMKLLEGNEGMYFNERESRNKLEMIKKLYNQILACEEDRTGRIEMQSFLTELLKYQKEDGSFSTIESYRCDGDIRVAYAYMPTFYATASMMYVDLHSESGLTRHEMEALIKGLKFAIGRQLVGHGFDGTDSLIKTLRIYAKAGMYKWINVRLEEGEEFKSVVDRHYKEFVKCVAEERTISDWNRDFSEEFKREIEDYEKHNEGYIWYAAYGSNINIERFMKYINRCKDKTAPVESKPYIFNYSMYFAGMSRKWGGSVAYIDWTQAGTTYGKIYLIKKQQFAEIQEMEGESYSKKVFLDYIDDIPVCTFTSDIRMTGEIMPSKEYIYTILEGLKEVYPNKSEHALAYYLYTRGFLSSVDKAILEYIRESEHAKTVKELIDETYMTKTCVTRSIKELHRLGLIVQDRRSVRLNITDEDSMVYTNKDSRELIDILTII